MNFSNFIYKYHKLLKLGFKAQLYQIESINNIFISTFSRILLIIGEKSMNDLISYEISSNLIRSEKKKINEK